ncbi:MAG: EAL domain-containing protein [Dehalococcoidia bacterium]|nr:EAL domain-containing protein [Dehalococcoidia bacterium]
MLSARALARLASAGLVAVFLALGAVFLLGAHEKREAFLEMQRAADLNEAFREARENYLRLDRALARYRDTADVSEFEGSDEWIEELESALVQSGEFHDDHIDVVIDDIESHIDEQVALAAVYPPAGPGVSSIPPPRLPPPEQFRSLPAVLDPRGAGLELEAEAQLSQYQAREEQFLWVLGIAFAAGLTLVVLLIAAQRHYTRRHLAQLAELQHLRQAIRHDSLTGLGNRRWFEEQLLSHAGTPGQPLTLAMIDVDQFKEVNDTWGHDYGDQLLRDVGRVLAESCEGEGNVFRIGGDEFAVIFATDAVRAERLASHARVLAEARLDGRATLSIGLSSCSRERHDEALLRQQADAALYEAKLRGRNQVVSFEATTGNALLFPAAQIQAVRRLLTERQLDVHFQPIWDVATNAAFAYEALARPDPEYGLSGPTQAFDIAERFGRTAELDWLCRERTLAHARELPPDALLFMNLSPHSITHQSFRPEALLREIEAAGLSPDRVVFEITERSSVPADVIATVALRMQRQGLRVALDDVGSGNNGLEMLRKVPFEYVKVDQAVVQSATESGTGRATFLAILAILAFAAEAGARVIAEGIETPEMLGLVDEISRTGVPAEGGLVHAMQGFLLGRPHEGFEVSGVVEDLAA